MKVSKELVPVYHFTLDDLEASSAIHAMRSVVSALSAQKNDLGPYQKAALAFARNCEKVLLDLGAKNHHQGILEKYPDSKLSRPKAAKKPEKSKPLKGKPVPKDEDEDLEENLDELIADDSELLGEQ